MKLRTISCLAIFTSFAIAQLSSAPRPSPDPQTPLISTRSTLVRVPALVRTKSGELVYTLTANDFTLTDNTVQQKLTLDPDDGDRPLALVVAIQTGGAGARQFDRYRSLVTMVDAVVGNVPHQVAVVGFDSTPTVFQDFTSDNNLVNDSIHDLAPGNGGAAILDTVAFSVDLLRKQPLQYRYAVLLLSETVDHGSQTTLQDALRAVSDTNTTIYSVAFSTSKSEMKQEASQMFSGPPGPPGGCISHDPSADPTVTGNHFQQAWDCLSLLAPPLRAAKMAYLMGVNGLSHNAPKTIAELTGGEYFRFNSIRSLESDLLTISNHIPNRYILSFQPESPQPGPHSIELHLRDHPNLSVTARTTYWAIRPPDGQTPH